MQQFADLEIELHFLETGRYGVDFRFHLPQSETEVRSTRAVAQIDPAGLLPLLPQSDAYAEALTAALFADPELRQRFGEGLAVARAGNLGLRVRLAIDARAPELHSLVWEMLRNPLDGTRLCAGENIVFSRYLSSQDWRPAPLRHKSNMQALVVVANPSDLGEYSLDPVDVPAEVERARTALGSLPFTLLGCEASGEAATPEGILAHLRERAPGGGSRYDILWLICHGSLRDGEPWLWLEDEGGKVNRFSGSDLAARFTELSAAPLLVVLSACDSARSDVGPALSALGPRLSQAGVPAVIAMQGKISMPTNAAFTAAFFQALQQDGVVDQAMTLARGQVRERPDSWMPALFMRLRSGRIWYLPGFGGKDSTLEIWDSLCTFLQEGLSTILLGPELTNGLLGDEREIALQWSERHGYPLSSEDRDRLPRVAQYVSTYQNLTYLRISYQKALREAILQRYAAAISTDLAANERWKPADLLQALQLCAARRWPEPGNNPYAMLAKLGARIYLTVEHGDLLEQALQAAGRSPQVRMCPWNEHIRARRPLWQYDDDPTPEAPLVYHLFGHFSEPASLVFTEDDTYDYLISMTEHRDLIPDAVTAALADSALFFLGFQLDDWQFRLFYRLIMNQPGAEGLEEYSHVAAQIAPLEGPVEDADGARHYMQRYLERKRIHLYWGTNEEFLHELLAKLSPGAA